MANETVTSLPTVANATSADIIYAVQGGVSVQETLSQVLALVANNIITTYAGNPNGHVAGTAYETLCWDTTDNILWICTTGGSSSTAVWKTIIGSLTNGQVLIGSTGNAPVASTLTAGTNISITNASGSITIAATGAGGFSWTHVTGTSQSMLSNSGYVADNAALVTLSLPATSVLGDELEIVGRGAGGWSISQASGQQIIIGSNSSTLGAGGSVSSSNRRDSLYLVCTNANTEWTSVGGPQGNITIV